jgi:hypothetical protein
MFKDILLLAIQALMFLSVIGAVMGIINITQLIVLIVCSALTIIFFPENKK